MTIGTTEQHVRVDTDGTQLAHAVLHGLGLELARRSDVRHQGQVHVDGVVAADVLPELAHGLEERLALDIADGAADFHDEDVDVLGGCANRGLDLVRDVRNNLHRAPQIVAAALLGDDRAVDLTGGDVGIARGYTVRESLVMPEVEIGLGAIVGDEHLAVLVWAHRARVDVDIRIALHKRDTVAVGFEQTPDRSRG